jgi:thioredoxin-like negative regulator of GroEL
MSTEQKPVPYGLRKAMEWTERFRGKASTQEAEERYAAAGPRIAQAQQVLQAWEGARSPEHAMERLNALRSGRSIDEGQSRTQAPQYSIDD